MTQIAKSEIIPIMLKTIGEKLNEELDDVDYLDGHIKNAKMVLADCSKKVI